MKTAKPRVWTFEEMVRVTHDPKAHDDLVARIKPLLAGRPPQIQGAVLAELVGILFAGHAPEVREDMMEHWLRLVRQMIEGYEKVVLRSFGGKWPAPPEDQP